MLANFAFTLYELFGYLLPGGVALVGIILLAWALFVPLVPLGIATFQPGLAMWTGIVVASYVLGHAAQAVGNKVLRSVEKSALAMNDATWMRDQARHAAAELLGVPAEQLDPRSVYRILDEYAVQTGRPGDRDMFIYREGFYRGTCTALFFLSTTLLVRSIVPGSSIQFTKWLYPISCWQGFATAIITAGLGWLFLQRYKRFAEYRVTRAALSALVIRKVLAGNASEDKRGSAPE